MAGGRRIVPVDGIGTGADGAAWLYVLPCAYEDHAKLGIAADPMVRMRAFSPRYYAFFDLGGGGFPGTAGRYWYGGFESVDASCMATITTLATGGTVSVTQTGNTSGTNFKANLTGIQFGTDTLNGNIEARYCQALGTTPCGSLLARPPGPAE